ncbi:MAG: hypothetical protein O3C10_09190, partial [Chloroflexi bacterium]|nr:hypothetical protein [Chloroflexota bacterium]
GGSGGSGSVRTVSGRYIHLLTLRQPGSSDAGPESFTSLESPKSPGSGESDRHLAPPEHMEPPASGRSNGAVGHVSPDATTPLSDPAAAGDQRFFGKSAGYSIALREYGGDAAAWSAVLDCLGYSRNRRAFRQVALRLPWPVAQRAMECGGDASPLLRWAGGLGPKPRQLRGLRASAASPDWVLGGRPDNRPERRLDAAAVFARRWRERGPLDDIISAVRTAAGPKELIGRFLVAANSPGGRSLVGPGRAGEIVVNAVLPVVHAWSLIADRRDVGEKALQLYRDHPKLPENAITREMTALLAKSGGAPDIRGAREQQGLILMYRNMTAGSLFARPPQ